MFIARWFTTHARRLFLIPYEYNHTMFGNKLMNSLINESTYLTDLHWFCTLSIKNAIYVKINEIVTGALWLIKF